MSSKLYKKYISLKIENSEKIYLFKCGIFYIFISDDAKIVAPLLNLRLTNLNSIIVKCGFPVNGSEKYFKKIKELNLNVEIVTLTNSSTNIGLENCLNNKEFIEIIDNFMKIDIDNLSISQAFDILKDLQDRLRKLYNID